MSGEITIGRIERRKVLPEERGVPMDSEHGPEAFVNLLADGLFGGHCLSMINVSENPDGTGDKGLMLSVAALSRRAAVTLPQAEEVIAHLMDHLKTCPDCMVGEAIPDVVLGMRAAMKGGKP